MQKTNAAMWHEFRMQERAVMRDVQLVRGLIEDGHTPSRQLADAIKLPAETLALPNLRPRFDALVCDFYAQCGLFPDA
mgnify:CR=1 FL=1